MDYGTSATSVARAKASERENVKSPSANAESGIISMIATSAYATSSENCCTSTVQFIKSSKWI